VFDPFQYYSKVFDPFQYYSKVFDPFRMLTYLDTIDI